MKCDKKDNKEETSMTSGGEAFSEPLDKELIYKRKIERVMQKIERTLKIKNTKK